MFTYCRNNPVSRIDASGTVDYDCYDNDPLDQEDLLKTGEGGGSYANAYNSIDAGYSYGVDLSQAANSSSFGGGLYTNGYTAYCNYSNPNTTSKASGNAGWRLGNDITSPTKKGNVPSWSTVRQRYWKNEAFYNADKYVESDLDRMRKGLAPIGPDGFPMELHHPYGRSGTNFYVFTPLSQIQHRSIHYG